jgi:hypothetical protein
MIAQSVPEAGQIRLLFSADGPSGRTQVVYQEGVVMDRHEPERRATVAPTASRSVRGRKVSRMTSHCCLWCQTPFSPRSDGGRRQRYCSSTCRRFFDGAARAWVRQAVNNGTLTLADLQKASPATRAFVTALIRYSAKRLAG